MGKARTSIPRGAISVMPFVPNAKANLRTLNNGDGNNDGGDEAATIKTPPTENSPFFYGIRAPSSPKMIRNAGDPLPSAPTSPPRSVGHQSMVSRPRAPSPIYAEASPEEAQPKAAPRRDTGVVLPVYKTRLEIEDDCSTDAEEDEVHLPVYKTFDSKGSNISSSRRLPSGPPPLVRLTVSSPRPAHLPSSRRTVSRSQSDTLSASPPCNRVIRAPIQRSQSEDARHQNRSISGTAYPRAQSDILNERQLQEHDWYHGTISRISAEARLQAHSGNAPKARGIYLVRKKENDHAFVISVLHSGDCGHMIDHILVERPNISDGSPARFFQISGYPLVQFDTVLDVVASLRRDILLCEAITKRKEILLREACPDNHTKRKSPPTKSKQDSQLRHAFGVANTVPTRPRLTGPSAVHAI